MNCIFCLEEIVSTVNDVEYPEHKWKHIDGYISCFNRADTVATPPKEH